MYAANLPCSKEAFFYLCVRSRAFPHPSALPLCFSLGSMQSPSRLPPIRQILSAGIVHRNATFPDPHWIVKRELSLWFSPELFNFFSAPISSMTFRMSSPKGSITFPRRRVLPLELTLGLVLKGFPKAMGFPLDSSPQIALKRN